MWNTATSVHRRQNIGRNLSFLLGAAGSGLDHRRKGAGPRNPILTVLGQQRSPPDVFTSLAQGKPPVGSRWHLGFPSTSIAAAPIESGGFSWGQRWESLSALIRFWEAGR